MFGARDPVSFIQCKYIVSSRRRRGKKHEINEQLEIQSEVDDGGESDDEEPTTKILNRFLYVSRADGMAQKCAQTNEIICGSSRFATQNERTEQTKQT